MLMACLSPANVQTRAQAALQDSPITDLRGVLVHQRGNVLVISGEVSSFYHKQLAQETVWALCKDLEMELTNRVEVR